MYVIIWGARGPSRYEDYKQRQKILISILLFINRRNFLSQYMLPFYHFRTKIKAMDGVIATKQGISGLIGDDFGI